MIITAHAYARAGLVGNPSDGYFGKTISFLIRNFRATVQLWESPQFEILPSSADLGRSPTIGEFLRDLRLNGYYGGMRLIKATIKKFHDYCQKNDLSLHDRDFTVSYSTDIPRLVGLAGSSAIVTATMRALMQFYGVQIPKQYLPTLILSVEKDELGISAGLQDRVIQVYEGIVYMDFERSHLEKNGYGIYEPLNPPKLPPLYVAFDPARAEVSDIPHRNLRELFNRGDPTVLAAMQRYRQITDIGKEALMKGDWEALNGVINENFDLRRTIMNIAPENLRMVEVARSTVDQFAAADIVNEAHARNVKVISYDRLIKNCKLDYYVSTDNVKIGELEASYLTRIKPVGKYALIGGAKTDNNSMFLYLGQMNELQPLVEKGDIKIVYNEFTDSWGENEGYEQTQKILKNTKDIDAIIAGNDAIAMGVIKALSEAGKEGSVLICGMDADLRNLQEIVAGHQTCTIYKPYEKMAATAAELAMKLGRGENVDKTYQTISNGEVLVPSVFYNGVIVNRENLKLTVISEGYQKEEEIYKKK